MNWRFFLIGDRDNIVPEPRYSRLSLQKKAFSDKSARSINTSPPPKKKFYLDHKKSRGLNCSLRKEKKMGIGQHFSLPQSAKLL